MKFSLECAKPDQLQVCYEIICEGKIIQAERGIKQWTASYPDEGVIRQDILSGFAYLVLDGSVFAAYFSLTGIDDIYENICEGAWNYAGPYRTLHRLAIARNYLGHGLGKRVLDFASELCLAQGYRVIRTDTVSKNYAMRHLLEKSGFRYGGIINAPQLKLVAYEKFLS